jgi:hypothetical protein
VKKCPHCGKESMDKLLPSYGCQTIIHKEGCIFLASVWLCLNQNCKEKAVHYETLESLGDD